MGDLLVIRLTIDMPRWVWWLALHFRLAIALEVEGELLAPLDLVQHGRPLTLIYGGWWARQRDRGAN